jgi:hypothetical protein
MLEWCHISHLPTLALVNRNAEKHEKAFQQYEQKMEDEEKEKVRK